MYWLILILELIPFFAVGVFFFLLDFLMIDKSDEYQLINFITRFKSLFFLSYGLIKLIVQYIQYYRCVVFSTSLTTHTCNINGPGSYMFVYPEAAALVVQLLIVWTAFFMLQCAKPKGHPKFKYQNRYFKNQDR